MVAPAVTWRAAERQATWSRARPLPALSWPAGTLVAYRGKSYNTLPPTLELIHTILSAVIVRRERRSFT